MEPSDEHAQVNGIRLHYQRHGGDGPPVVLLHGWPQTGYCWRFVAPALARSRTVIVPDLRGYGGSEKPATGYDKRTLAEDMSQLVRVLGFSTVDVVGHDRGARVAHRWALDRPEDITRLSLLDILPTLEVMRTIDKDSAAMLWHWFFHLQPDLPELLVAGNERAYLSHFFHRQSYHPETFDESAVAVYEQAFAAPDALHASFNDYRAGFTEDLAMDEHDSLQRVRIHQPLQVLWGADGGLGRSPVLDIWSRYADTVTGHAIDRCKHFLPEEQPAETIRALLAFLDG